MKRPRLFLALVLAVLAFGLYARTGTFGYLDFDDEEYVFNNPDVLAGLSGYGIGWAFGTYHGANWHPLTWMSHMLDVDLFGPEPGRHHLVNAALHAVNAAFLFVVLEAATTAFWPSAVVAALFAVHPLNVETVAWISQRKSLLSTLFLLLALGAYVRWTRERGVWRYVAVAALLALGLLAKPMLVSAPLLFLALDFWPLERMNRESTGLLLLEKTPFFVLAAGSCVITVFAQKAGGAVAPTETYPIGERVANALVSAVLYLRDAVWPAHLAAFYPHPASIGASTNVLAAVAAGLLLAGITFVVLWLSRSRPWLLFGWASYLIALTPVIGIVQVGSQARADRYTYVPMIGIFVAVVWELAAVAQARNLSPKIAGAAAAIVVGLFAATAFAQIGTWRDGETLYNHALRVTKKNWLASNNLGNVLMRRDEMEKALACFREAIRMRPGYEEAYYNEGIALNALQRPAEAIPAFEQNLRLAPANTDGWANYGYSLVAVRRYPEALRAFETALSQRPDDAMALHGAGAMKATLGDRNGALQYLARLEHVDRVRASELRRDMGIGR
jgi:Tfp pilus assembly protein PilF